jgi:AraC-like DNA-binding protein
MFPQFNIHSTPLLILVAQGLIFALLLFLRYRKQRMVADILMALLLLIMAFHRTTYTIGFMGWYDTFQDTKINYFLPSFELAIGPIIYLYVRTLLQAPFRFFKRDWWHFLPISLFLGYRLLILLHDMQQPNWDVGYEGDWQRNFHLVYVSPILQQVQFSSILLYLAFTIQLFRRYQQQIRQYFSNTYRLELNWIRLFLAVYCFLFVYGSMTDLVDAFIMELNYNHRWWVHFFSAIAIVFIGIKAYFTDLSSLHALTLEIDKTATSSGSSSNRNYDREKLRITNFIEQKQAYLQPDLTLKELAKGTRMSLHEASEVINSGFGYNFNEFINRYRVDEVKKRLLDPDHAHLSILAIAYDSGFNSKASFNRIFKQLTGQAPSEFRQNESQ